MSTAANLQKKASPDISSMIIFSLIDHYEVFEALTDNQAGQLIKHIFRYFNNGPSRIEDPVVRDAFNKLRRDILSSIKKFKE